MITPGKKFAFESDGETLESRVLTEDQQLELIDIMEKIGSVEAGSVSAMRTVVTSTKRMAEIAFPDMTSERRAELGHNRIISLTAEVIAAHMLGTETKKKSGSPHSSDQGTSAAAAVPDVLVTTLE